MAILLSMNVDRSVDVQPGPGMRRRRLSRIVQNSCCTGAYRLSLTTTRRTDVVTTAPILISLVRMVPACARAISVPRSPNTRSSLSNT